MTKYYTQYWSKNDGAREEQKQNLKGELLDHTSGNQFRGKWDVRPGDFVYIVTVSKGLLYLISRIEVDQVCSREEAEKRLGRTDLYDAEYHLIAKPGTELPMQFNRKVSLAMTRQLRFLTPKGIIKPLVFSPSAGLDKQTLRGVRRLTPASAFKLDGLIWWPNTENRTRLDRPSNHPP